MSDRIVIVGGGQAGHSAAASLRKYGHSGAITIVSDEGLPYQRPPLSKAFLLGELDGDRLLLKPQEFYADKQIEVLTGAAVERIDRDRRRIEIGGHTLDYERLVLATGSRPRRLDPGCGGDLAGVQYLRTQSDALALGEELRPGRHLLVVGGGYVGLEVAAVAAKRGLKVTVVEFAPRILHRVAAGATATYFKALHGRYGVDIREGVGLDALRGNGRVSVALLTDGTEMAIDAAVIGTGIVPNVELAAESELAIENGIKVDAFGRTSDEDIWAAGDCCSFPFKGARIRLESVPNAIEQADAVAANILGRNAPYVARPWFWSDQYDVKLQIAGLNSGYDQVVERGGTAQRSVWYYRGPDLLAVDAMNDARSYVVARKMLESGYSPPQDRVADAEFDLKSLL